MRLAEVRVRADYGFVPDLTQSVRQNARRVLGETPPAYFFSSPSNLAFHDLTPAGSLPPATKAVLGLSAKFVPIPRDATSKRAALESFERLERDLGWKTYHAGSEQDFIKSKLFVKTSTQPPLPPPYVSSRMSSFEVELRKLFGRRPRLKSNLTKFQQIVLDKLMAAGHIIVAAADKNLGPVAVLLDRYIKDGLKHLQDHSTYKIIPEQQAQEEDAELRLDIHDWMRRYRQELPRSTRRYLEKKLEETKEDPFGYFYLTYKLHKNPVKTRPVCSDCASTPHALGQWVDGMLQPIVKAQKAYFKDTFELKHKLHRLEPGRNWRLITFDAVSMYTNIDLEVCIERISSYLRHPDTQENFPHYNPDMLIKAITIVMYNSRMRFGDIVVKMIRGVAMGMAPAPPIANLFMAIVESTTILPVFKEHLALYVRFIDDGLAAWKCDPDPATDASNYKAFCDALNSTGLSWTFTEPSDEVEFMDLTIAIEGNRIVTNLYEKPLALHLYIPPHSCHPPRCHESLVTGMVLRIFRLCSRQRDVTSWLTKFYRYLLARGYQNDATLPLLEKGIAKATTYISTTDEQRQRQKMTKEKKNSTIFLHMKYHPCDPPSARLQQLWRRCVLHPPGRPHLTCLKNQFGEQIPTNRLVIAYGRHQNLGNLLTHRKIGKRPGPKVSSYL